MSMMPPASEDDTTAAVDRYEWERLLRRVQLGASTKLVALTMATYADRDGSRVHPGVTRLALVTGLSERSVQSALKKLRDLGLVEQLHKGGRSGDGRAFASIYRLTIPADYLELPGVLSPQELPDEEPSQPATDDAQPATGAPQPATDDAQPALGAPHQPTYQPLTNPHTNTSIGSVTQVQNAHDNSEAKIIPLNVVGGRR